jgi:nucleotide-binding universal stress UspA family protein
MWLTRRGRDSATKLFIAAARAIAQFPTEAGGPSMSDQSIVVGLDGSENSARALRWAIDYAHHTGGEVLAVHVLQQPVPAGWPAGARDDLRAALHDQAAENFEEWTLPLRKDQIPHSALMVNGLAAEALLKVAKDEHAGMIVVGRRGLGGLARLLLGSVSHRVLQESPVPVVVIPPPQDR